MHLASKNPALPRLFAIAFTTASCLVGTAIAPAPTQAQTPGREPGVVEFRVGARAAGLGAAQLGVADSDLFLTHAALAGSGGMQAGFSRFGKNGTHMTLTSSRQWFGGKIGLGFGLEALEYRGGAPGSRAGGLDPFFGDGSMGISETSAALGVSSDLFGVDFGVTTRLITSRFDASRKTHATMDIGVTRRAGQVNLALTVRSLGPERTISGIKVKPPTEVVLGGGFYGRPVGILDLGMAAELRRRADGEFLGGGGLELGYYPVNGRTFVGRVGFRNVPEGDAKPFSVGGSYWGDDLVLEWGWHPIDGNGGVHTFTLGWR